MQTSQTATSLEALLPYLTPPERERLAGLTVAGRSRWGLTARPEQLPPPGDWQVWLILAGRGWGKTLTGAHWTLEQSRRVPRLAVVAPTFSDARDTCVEGESGLQAICPGLTWNRTNGLIVFPSGCRGKVFSAEEPDRLRGPNNYAAWCDELGAWRNQQATWDQLMYTLRKGRAQCVVTTTPRPGPLLKALQARPTTITTRRRTTDNLANLSPAYYANVIAPYIGTRQGRQELDAEDLEDTPGALWGRDLLERNRVTKAPPLVRVVVAVDPSTSADGGGDACGIVAAGLGTDGHGYVLADLTLNASPKGWATAAVAAYHTHRADALIAEANNGGALVQVNIGTIPGSPPVRLVHASRGKQTRAEPIANLDEQGRVHHVGPLTALEDEMTSWVPGDANSPNRVDARVWALTELQISAGQPFRASVGGARPQSPSSAPMR